LDLKKRATLQGLILTGRDAASPSFQKSPVRQTKLENLVSICLLVVLFMGIDTSIAGWSEQQRLLFVERLLFWRGTINRRDLCDHFGISLPQATKDLVAYTTLNAGACQYDVRRKCYVASPRMRMVLQEPNFSEDMKMIAAAMLDAAEGVAFTMGFSRPRRVAFTRIHRGLSLAACNGEAVEALYWSVRSGAMERRWLSPRAFGHDGLRWHVRALCHRDRTFKDFVIGRFEDLRAKKTCSMKDQFDVDWVENETLVLRPNPSMSEPQRRALEMDYGMENGVLELVVKRAMRLYTLRRLGFIHEPKRLPLLNELKQLQLVALDSGN
jgi:hypothetical protein